MSTFGALALGAGAGSLIYYAGYLMGRDHQRKAYNGFPGAGQLLETTVGLMETAQKRQAETLASIAAGYRSLIDSFGAAIAVLEQQAERDLDEELHEMVEDGRKLILHARSRLAPLEAWANAVRSAHGHHDAGRTES